jgi:predicted AAA+ superfamily ATPase
MYIDRKITLPLINHRQWFPVINPGGPRQSCKTTLLQHLFPELPYVNLENHYFPGNIFENAMIAELYKKRTNKAGRPVFWYWQDPHGNEVDLLTEEDIRLKAVEIKSGQTYNTRMVSGLKLWQKLSGNPSEDQFLISAGDKEAEIEYGQLLPRHKGVGY